MPRLDPIVPADAPAYPASDEYPVDLMFPIGETTVLFHTDTGLSASTTVSVDSLADDSPGPLRLEFHQAAASIGASSLTGDPEEPSTGGRKGFPRD